MGFPWKRLLVVGKAVASVLLPGVVVQSIEAIEEAAGELKGPEKKAAVLKMSAAAVTAIEGAADKDVVNDPAVAAATASFVDAYVALRNAIEAAHAAKV